MTRQVSLVAAIAGVMLALACNVASAEASDAIEVGNQVPDAKQVKDGLFPEDSCKELQAAGMQCMGFKPPVRYSLPAKSFAVGSAVLPAMLVKQLDVFADVLRGKKGSKQVVRIEGHADASGSDEVNQVLSQKRADAVKDYLVKKGADENMLKAVGMGSKAPKVADPLAAENRRVEIGRQE